MEMIRSAQGIITAAALAAALTALSGYVFRVRDWVQAQNRQEEKLQKLGQRHDQDVREIREEQTLLVYGMLACLKGLKEQGCNGSVTQTIDRIERYLNRKAHE